MSECCNGEAVKLMTNSDRIIDIVKNLDDLAERSTKGEVRQLVYPRGKAVEEVSHLLRRMADKEADSYNTSEQQKIDLRMELERKDIIIDTLADKIRQLEKQVF